MFGMAWEGKQIFRIGDRQYELREVDGPLRCGDRVFPAQFDHEAGVLKISRTVPVQQRAWVVAVAVSDACQRLWKPVPVIWPNWRPDDRSAFGSPRRGPASDPPRP